jgi:hypothetical protein
VSDRIRCLRAPANRTLLGRALRVLLLLGLLKLLLLILLLLLLLLLLGRIACGVVWRE